MSLGTSDHYAEEDTSRYHLTQGDRRGYERLRIVREDSSYFSVRYDDIHVMEGEADGTKLTLCIKGGLLVTLIGERLEALAGYLEECRVRKVYIYRSGVHTLYEDNTPVINGIVETSPQLLPKKEY